MTLFRFPSTVTVADRVCQCDKFSSKYLNQLAELFEMNGNMNGQSVRRNSLAIIINGANLTKTNNVVKVSPAVPVLKDAIPPTPTPVFIP